MKRVWSKTSRTRSCGLVCSLLILGGAVCASNGCGGGRSTERYIPSDNSATRDAPYQLFTRWRLVATSGGFSGAGYPFTPGTDFVTFTSGGAFSRVTGGQTMQGTYQVTVRKTAFSETDLPVITYSTTTQTEVITEISDTKLVLSQEAADGYQSEYERVVSAAE